jgi:hypothetical protein
VGNEPITSGRDTATDSNPAAQPEPLDCRALLAEVGGDFELLASLAALFDEQAALQMTELRGAIECGDANRLNQAAHALKSMIGIWRQGGAYELAAHLEEMGREAIIEGAALDGQRLDQALRQLQRQIGALLATKEQ